MFEHNATLIVLTNYIKAFKNKQMICKNYFDSAVALFALHLCAPIPRPPITGRLTCAGTADRFCVGVARLHGPIASLFCRFHLSSQVVELLHRPGERLIGRLPGQWEARAGVGEGVITPRDGQVS